MKSSFLIRCKCGNVLVLEATGTQKFEDTSCPECKSAIWILDNGFVSTRVFNKSWTELNSGDFTLAIILSAMAVECELARVFVKWKELDLGLPADITQADRDLWDAELRQWLKIGVRLDKVCEFLTDQSFDAFIANHTNLATSIRERHPDSAGCDSLRKFFERQLFWRRNAVVHRGRIDSGKSDAETCRLASETLFQIISEMDFLRVRRLDANHSLSGLTT